MLCGICQSIEYDDLIEERDQIGFRHHKTFTSLEEASRSSNCDFCAAVWKAVQSDPSLTAGDIKWKQQPVYLRCFPSSGHGDYRDKSNLLVYCSVGKGEKTQKNLAFFGLYIERTRAELETGVIDTTRPESSLIPARNVSNASSDDECFAMARLWLNQCTACEPHGLKDIPQAREEEAENFRPSRTIDVGPPEGMAPPRLVCHKNGPGEESGRIEWVTLSHSWGGSSPICTKLDTLAKHQSSIPVFSMPKTFQDAILLVRKLGLRHLWIDSLCIIQDSPEDWAFEAAQMGKIYQFGVLNIAADASPNCDGGLFELRSSARRDVVLPLRSKKLGLDTHMYARLGHWDDYLSYVLGANSTLTSRGWVMQEAILSPRTLHYGKDQLYWECEHLTLCEGNMDAVYTQAEGRKLVGHFWVSHKFVLPQSLLGGVGKVPDEKDIIYRGWLQLIRNYTTRHLTVSSDIFASLAGLASIFQQTLKENYLAGIFEGDLMKGLLWRTVDTKNAVSRNMNGIPSWSWAAIIGAVEFEISVDSSMSLPQSVGTFGARIISAKVHHSNSTPSAQLTNFTGGEIVLEGLMLENTDRLSYLRTKFKSLGKTAKFEHSRQAAGYMNTKAEEERIFIEDLAVLHLGAWEWWFRSGKGSTSRFYRRFSGLLLRRVEGRDGVYERVGMVSLTFWFRDVAEECGFEEGEDDRFLEHEDWKRRVVRII